MGQEKHPAAMVSGHGVGKAIKTENEGHDAFGLAGDSNDLSVVVRKNIYKYKSFGVSNLALLFTVLYHSA